MHVGLSLRFTNMLYLNCFCRAMAHVVVFYLLVKWQGYHRQQSTWEQASLIPSAVTDNFLNLLAPGVWMIKTIIYFSKDMKYYESDTMNRTAENLKCKTIWL